MTILASLNKAYDRLALRGEVPNFGYSNEKAGFVISLNPDGSIAGAPRDIRDRSGKKPQPLILSLPQPVKRTSGVKPNFLWDKSSYVLGITETASDRTTEEHQAFVAFHEQILNNSDDEGLKAFLAFLHSWKPENFGGLNWPDKLKEDIKDQNIIFALEKERLEEGYIHDRPAAQKIWASLTSEEEKSLCVCLVSGQKAPIARLHPSIKGVWGAQSSGASIVSFNLDAFASYNHEQGDNAPVSEAAAFAYTTALNKLLEKGSNNRIQLGDASTVFWADASSAKTAATAEAAFSFFFEANEDAIAKDEIKPILENIRQGKPLTETAPELASGVRFYVLGLSPNAARISIRFWLEDDFGNLMRNYERFLDDLRIDPKDRDETISLWKYLRETAVLGKAENIAPNLSGEWMRSILTGRPYPLTLLTNILIRIRADKSINARRVSILKAVLVRNFKSKEAPVSLDPDNKNKGYLLGRLFAVYERIQTAALGDKINATVKDKFYASASAQPRKIFPLLDKGSVGHLSKLRKTKHGYEVALKKLVAGILDLLSPSNDPYPTMLSTEEQALFTLGYYHQHSEFFKSKSTDTVSEKESNQ